MLKKWTKRIWRHSQLSYAKRSISSSTLNLHLLRKTPMWKVLQKQLDSKSCHTPVDLFAKLSMNVSMFSFGRTSAEENSPLSQKRARHEVSFKIMEINVWFQFMTLSQVQPEFRPSVSILKWFISTKFTIMCSRWWCLRVCLPFLEQRPQRAWHSGEMMTACLQKAWTVYHMVRNLRSLSSKPIIMFL